MKKLAVAAAAFAAMNFAHATVFTLNSTGAVTHGVDGLGLFGVAGKKLDGLPFSMTVTLELDETARYFSDPLRYAQVKTTAPFIIALTIGDDDYATRVTDTPRTSATLSNAYSTNNGSSDGAQVVGQGNDALGRQVLAWLQFSTYFLRSNSLTQETQLYVDSWNYPSTQWVIGTGPNNSYFDASGRQLFTINGVPATLPVPAPDPIPVSDPPPTSNPNPVPEPASAMLFGAGLLGFAALRRRFK